MARESDIIYMHRCLDLACKAEGYTSPNPMVGAVVVHEGVIIGEGFHLKAGSPHAEVHAINSVSDRTLLPLSTLYVSLEPCSHQGRTPPCTDLIIKSRIPRVIIGTKDTSTRVAGSGIEKLRQAGIEVVVGVEESKCREINKRFFTWNEKKRPYVILKWARSADGYIDLHRHQGDAIGPNWITGMTERILVHRWRASEDAILAGGATIRMDNPSLDVRLWNGINPKRIIVSRSGNIDPGSKIFNGAAEVTIFTRNSHLSMPGAGIVLLRDDQETIKGILSSLYEMEIQSLLVEGGAFIINEFVKSELWDEARRFTGKKNFCEGISDPFPTMRPERVHNFESSILEIGYNKYSYE